MNPQLVNLHLCYGPRSRPASFEEIGMVPLPKQTSSYVPVAHDKLVTIVKRELAAAKLEIVQELFVLWRNGQRMFGMFQVNHADLPSPEQAMIVAVRNSFDKSLPAMIASGGQVFVCDNLIFNGEVVLGRKHTSNIFRDLDGLVKGAMEILFKHWKKHFARVDAYKAFDLGDTQAHDLIAKLFLAGAIGKTQVADVIEQFHSPNHPEFRDRNLWSLTNSFTEVWKGRLDLLPSYSKILHKEFDAVAGLV